jgi:hypothetical protein
MMETDSVSEKLCSPVFRKMDDGQSPKTQQFSLFPCVFSICIAGLWREWLDG